MTSIRAVAQIDADPSGLIRGAAQARAALEKVWGGIGGGAVGGVNLQAGLGGIQGYLERIGSAVAQRAEQLQQLATTYSPEASAAAIGTEVAQMQADQAVGSAVGPYAAAVERNRADRIAREGMDATANREQLGNGMIVWDSIKGAFGAMGGALKDSALMNLGGDFSTGPLSLMAERTGFTDYMADKFQPFAQGLVDGDAQLANPMDAGAQVLAALDAIRLAIKQQGGNGL